MQTPKKDHTIKIQAERENQPKSKPLSAKKVDIPDSYSRKGECGTCVGICSY